MSQVWIFLGIYFLALLGISFFGRKKSAENFILADRKLGKWAAANSLAATAIGGGILLVGGAYIYQFGISAIWFFVGKICGYILLTIFLKKISDRISQKKYNTLADFFLDFHGKKIHRFVAAVIAVDFLGWALIGFVGGAGIIVILSGIPYWLAAIAMLAAVLVYTLIGGFQNVIRTDYLQWIALATIFVLFFINFSGNLKMVESVQWDFWNAGTEMIAAFFLAGLTFPLAAMEVWQRMFALKKSKQMIAAMTRFGVMYLAFGIVLCLIMMIIRTFDATLEPDFAIVEGIVKFFPPALVALGTVAFFAAIMSSLDSYLFVTNATVVHDFCDPHKKLSPENIEKKMRVTLSILGVLILALGFVWRDIVDISIFFAGVSMVVAMLVIFSWASRHRISENALIFSGTVGLIGLIVVSISTPVGAPWLLAALFFSIFRLLFWGISEKISTTFSQKK